MKLKNRISAKPKLSTKLMSFLPTLKIGSEELFEKVKEDLKDYPVEVVNRRWVSGNANSDKIEALTFSKESFYEKLLLQIDAPFFPTSKSKKVAFEIVKDINSEGFFEGSEEEIAKRLEIEEEFVRRVRERFLYLEPAGVGAKTLQEALEFQLFSMELEEDIFELAIEIVRNLDKIDSFTHRKYFKEALSVIRGLNFAPAIEFKEKEEVIPEIVIQKEDNELKILINDDVYPEIIVDDKRIFSQEELKVIRSVIDALDMRKSTLKKIALMIVELQYDFFIGGDLKPMKIQDIADELGYNPSTISRAVSNKYLLCDRGVFELKYFFSVGFDEEVSANKIKEEIKKLIKNEDKSKPLSDEKLTEIINSSFKISLVRRTISKYRESLNIPSSRERKRMYKRGINCF